jgi:hypothetical protein
MGSNRNGKTEEQVKNFTYRILAISERHSNGNVNYKLDINVYELWFGCSMSQKTCVEGLVLRLWYF